MAANAKRAEIEQIAHDLGYRLADALRPFVEEYEGSMPAEMLETAMAGLTKNLDLNFQKMIEAGLTGKELRAFSRGQRNGAQAALAAIFKPYLPPQPPRSAPRNLLRIVR